MWQGAISLLRNCTFTHELVGAHALSSALTHALSLDCEKKQAAQPAGGEEAGGGGGSPAATRQRRGAADGAGAVLHLLLRPVAVAVGGVDLGEEVVDNVVGALEDAVGDGGEAGEELAVGVGEVVHLPTRDGAEARGRDGGAAAGDSRLGEGEVLGVGEQQEGAGGDVLHVAVAELEEEAATAVLRLVRGGAGLPGTMEHMKLSGWSCEGDGRMGIFGRRRWREG
uniref:Uncharacterized protein n=1 Tax=Oryza barthii TaxID=65489 RepID=A0A0D3G7U0_9ORYZ